MNGFKAQGATKPTAMGSLLQAATYGATIPVVYGQTQSPLLAIWAANLRQGTSNKKLKNFIAKLKGADGYEENVDFLLGHNPIMGVLQVMVNGGLYPLNFTSHTFSGIFTEPGTTLTIPDANFYFVIAVTTPQTYSLVVDDYGGQGSQTLSGTYNVPFWNEFEVGPDPTGNSGYRNNPFIYSWSPSDGAVVTISGAAFSSITVYYAQLTNATSLQPPLTKLRLAFENELGNGSEYADAPAPFNAQQIIYPQFAGCGSSDLDLGIAGAIPQLQPEVRGKWGVYPSGDADFVDMIEDIFKSGLAQAAIGATTAFTQMERGLSSYDLPGCIQKRQLYFFEALFGIPMASYNSPNTAGNFLVVSVAVGNPATTMTISSSNGESWTSIFPSGLGRQTWYTVAVGGANAITVGGATDNTELVLLEIGGVDTLDGISIGSIPSGNASITTTNQQNFAEYMLAISLTSDSSGNLLAKDPDLVLWDTIVGTSPSNSFIPNLQFIQERTVYTPGTYSIENNFVNPNIPGSMAIIAFKATVPAIYPKPLGDFIDLPSLELVRNQCRANGLWGSLTMNSQSAASDWLKSLYSAANAAPVYLGDKLYSIPYSEVSTAGNGAMYTSPTASGPVANLNANNGDFTVTPELQTGSRINLPNVLQLQIISREANYTQVVVTQPESGSISQYGVRKADPVVNNAIQDTSVALLILGIMVRRNQYGGDTYSFSLNAKWSLLSPMDLVMVTDPLANIINVPVRLTSLAEQSDASFQCQAEPFVYGMCSPTPFVPSPTSPTVNPTPVSTSAGNVNPPIIFEPTPQLYGLGNQAQLWMVISGASPNYGGCQVYVSTDGGSSYVPLGNPVAGNSVTGYSTADWPASSSPDTTNNLALDLTESNGVLASYAVATQDNFVYPCFVSQPGSSQNAVAGISFAIGNPLGTTEAGALFSGFPLPDLPFDAVVQGIYPVIIATSQHSADAGWTPVLTYGTASGMTPTSGGTSFPSIPAAPFTATEIYGPSIGTSITGIITQGIRSTIDNSSSDGNSSCTTVTAVGYAIYYTSSVPLVDPQIAAPFMVPSGQGVAWSLPSSSTILPSTPSAGAATNDTFGSTSPAARLAMALYDVDTPSVTAIWGDYGPAPLPYNAIDIAFTPNASSFFNNNHAGTGVFVFNGSAPSVSQANPMAPIMISGGLTTATITQPPGSVDPIDGGFDNATYGLSYKVGATTYSITLEPTTFTAIPATGNATAIATPAVQIESPYELMTYGVATLTAANKYTLMATGSGNHLDRAVLGAPASGVGVDHISGSRFAFLNPSGQGILKVALPPNWVGQTLFFKILSLNSFGTSPQSLADVPFFTYVPSGSSGSGVQIFQVNGS